MKWEIASIHALKSLDKQFSVFNGSTNVDLLHMFYKFNVAGNKAKVMQSVKTLLHK